MSNFTEARDILDACRAESSQAYRAFETLLGELGDPQNERRAARLLHEVAAGLEADARGASGEHARGAGARARIERVSLPPVDGMAHELVLLQLPSVFAPETWSFTFFEGLTRLPRTYFQDQTVAELGSGNGWISIALGRYAGARKIFGLDINPRATLSAKLNLYLNATDTDGAPLFDAQGRSLLEIVEFSTSDLLAHCRSHAKPLSRVIGCIPQVLDPDLERSVQVLPESASDEFLYALSNYCGKQGYVEDQFGLGLMARVLEESIELLRPGGTVVFNLGGRPGRAVLHRLFERRGFRVREVWQRRTVQAADTDIGTLVGIEERTRHRFEFFLGRHSDTPICAKTAQAYAQTGATEREPITHAIGVYEGRLPYPTHVKSIFALLEKEPFSKVKGAIDLAFDDDALAEEKLAFLSALALDLTRRGNFPYGETEGARAFRQGLCDYLEAYFDLAVQPSSLIVAPTRGAALQNLLGLYRPKLLLIDRELRHLAGDDSSELKLLEAPRRADLGTELVAALNPDLVVTGLADFEVRTSDAFAQLIAATARTGARLVVDISEQFELSSTPATNGVLAYLSKQALPPHVSVLCGLVRGRVYRDLELAFLYSEDGEQVRALALAAELSYSRAPLLTQRYYTQILSDLLSFRIAERNQPGARPVPRKQPSTSVAPAERPPLPPLSSVAAAAFEDPTLEAHTLPIDSTTLRLDYGENALEAPVVVAVHLFEAFARQNLSADETDPKPEIAALLEQRFGISGAEPAAIALGGGVAPLFSALARAAAREQATLLFPQGSYGYFVSAAKLVGARVASIPTFDSDGFKLTRESLKAALEHASHPWLFLNGPVINPTGSVYGEQELAGLLEGAAHARCPVILDAIFSGLEFAGNAELDLGPSLGPRQALELVVLGGISKELAAGGLRFGYAFSTSARHAAVLALAEREAVPHATLRFAAKKVLAELGARAADTEQALVAQRRTLHARATRLSDVLEACGWEPLAPAGGLFLVARPSYYLGRELELTLGGEPRRFRLDGDVVAEALFYATGLLVNNPTWTGIPEYCRFVYAVESDVFERALEALRAFRALF